MRGGNWNGALEMRVTRHDRALEARSAIDNDLLQLSYCAVNSLTRVHRPESSGGGYLIIATPSRVELGRDVTDFIVQQAIDERVNVLVAECWRFIVFQTLCDRVEPQLDLLTFIERQNSCAPQRDRPGFRRAHALRQAEQTNKARRITLLVHVVFAERDEPLVVERVLAGAAGDGNTTLVQLQRHGAAYPFLRHADKGVVGFAFRGPPSPLVHEIRIARGDQILRGECATIEHELLELGMRSVEQGAARRFIYSSRLHADETILDEVDDTDTVSSADLVERSEERDG